MIKFSLISDFPFDTCLATFKINKFCLQTYQIKLRANDLMILNVVTKFIYL